MPRIEFPVLATSRLAPGYREVIALVMWQIPERFTERVQPHFLTGLDPAYVGLHRYHDTDSAVNVGRVLYSETPHFASPHHQSLPKSQQHPTIVLPIPYTAFRREWGEDHIRRAIAHEFGHALHAVLDEQPVFPPISEYAQSNFHEAFAEAFECWMCDEDVVRELAPEAQALFDRLWC